MIKYWWENIQTVRLKRTLHYLLVALPPNNILQDKLKLAHNKLIIAVFIVEVLGFAYPFKLP
jgi:hypothetical protein